MSSEKNKAFILVKHTSISFESYFLHFVLAIKVATGFKSQPKKDF